MGMGDELIGIFVEACFGLECENCSRGFIEKGIQKCSLEFKTYNPAHYRSEDIPELGLLEFLEDKELPCVVSSSSSSSLVPTSVNSDSSQFTIEDNCRENIKVLGGLLNNRKLGNLVLLEDVLMSNVILLRQKDKLDGV